MNKVHFNRLDGIPACKTGGKNLTTCTGYEGVTCKPCLAWLWDFAFKMYNWLEDRRPAGGFLRRR